MRRWLLLLLDTNSNGLFMFLDVPPGEYFVQVWGWRTAADQALGYGGLRLYSTAKRTVFADSVELVDVWTTGTATPGP